MVIWGILIGKQLSIDPIPGVDSKVGRYLFL